MKIAISSEGNDLNSMVDPRFGRASGFIVFELENAKFEYIDNEQNLQSAQGAGIQAAKTVINAGAKAIITGNVGPKAHSALSSAGIEIFIGADDGSIQKAIDEYRAGSLKRLQKLMLKDIGNY